MIRLFGYLALLALMLTAIAPAAPPAYGASDLPAGVILSAGDLMDLVWDPVLSDPAGQTFKRYELLRGNTNPPTSVVWMSTDRNKDYVRLVGHAQGTNYYFVMNVVRCVAPCLTPADERRTSVFGSSAIGGGLDGVITKDVTLKPGAYAINASGVSAGYGVEIRSGAVLTIQEGTTIGAGGVYLLGGTLQATKATFNHTVINLGSSSDPTQRGTAILKGNTFTDYVYLTAYGASFLDMQEQNKGQISVELQGASNARIIKNTISGEIEARAGTHVTADGNTMTDSRIEVWGAGATADISGNTITSANRPAGGWIDVSGGATVTAIGNTLDWTGFHGTESTVLMWADGAGTKLTATGNRVLNGKVAATRGAWVDLGKNVIRGGGAAITVGCVFCGTSVQATGSIEDNTLQEGWGLELWTGSNAVSIHQNCVRGNNPGATLDPLLTSPIDLLNNWWGHVSGPNHPTNPTGLGDRIDGSMVAFYPWSPTDANCRETPPPVSDLGILGYEFVQTVQDLGNTVPLVAHKKTIVRVYSQSRSGPVMGATWKLTASRGGTTLDTLTGATIASQLPSIDALRAAKGGGTWIVIPDAWTSGTVEFKFELNYDHSYPELNFANNSFTRTVTFQQQAPLRVLYQPILYRPVAGQDGYLPDYTRLPSLSGVAIASFPISSLTDGVAIQPVVWTSTMRGSSDKDEYDRAKLLLKELTARLVRANSAATPGEEYRQVFGVFPGGDWQYITFCISDPAWANGAGKATYCFIHSEYMAHEIGHNLSLRHPGKPDSCDAKDPSSDWPYPVSIIREFGYDSEHDTIIPPTTMDLMTYCSPTWMSEFHYGKLRTGLSAMGAGEAAIQAEDAALAQEYRLVAGSVTATGVVSFDPAWTFASVQEPPSPPVGTRYCLELRDSGSALLQNHCFDLSFTTDSGQPTTIDTFIVGFPYLANVAKVQLRKDGALLGEATASAHAPTVTVTSPNGSENFSGDFTVSWTASDQDGGTLAYNVLYSSDNGTTWQPLALDLPGVTSYAVEGTLLPGSSSARIRVEVSDGFHTARDDSDAVFTSGDKPPLVNITQPSDGSTPPPELRLAGAAYDPEDGALGGASLVWTSSRAGSLGTGEVVDLSNLAKGEHVITLAATDSHGHTVIRTVTVDICGACVNLPVVMRR